MKNQIQIKLILIALISICSKLISQSDISGPPPGIGHTGINPAWYVGWNAATTFPLNVQHLGNHPIKFSTNSFQRMFIDNGNINAGFIGIGPNFSAPQSLLHLKERVTPLLNSPMRLQEQGPTAGF